jgi:hypothetical protein
MSGVAEEPGNVAGLSASVCYGIKRQCCRLIAPTVTTTSVCPAPILGAGANSWIRLITINFGNCHTATVSEWTSDETG